jgi:hypothetical protein
MIRKRSDWFWLLAFVLVLVLCGISYAQPGDTTLPTHAGALPSKFVGFVEALFAVVVIIWRGLGSSNWKELFTSGSWWVGLLLAANSFMIIIGHPIRPELQDMIVKGAPVLLALLLHMHINIWAVLKSVFGGTAQFAKPDKPGPTAYN